MKGGKGKGGNFSSLDLEEGNPKSGKGKRRPFSFHGGGGGMSLEDSGKERKGFRG